MPDRFIQIDRCTAGVRLTLREGDGRTGPTIATLVRQAWMNAVVWDIQVGDFLSEHRVPMDAPVHAWKDHQHLGSVNDLVGHRINMEADHG
jgi:hypothetical protein